jgi:hypothetical protein
MIEVDEFTKDDPYLNEDAMDFPPAVAAGQT